MREELIIKPRKNMDLEYKFGIMDQNFRVSEIVMILKGLAE